MGDLTTLKPPAGLGGEPLMQQQVVIRLFANGQFSFTDNGDCLSNTHTLDGVNIRSHSPRQTSTSRMLSTELTSSCFTVPHHFLVSVPNDSTPCGNGLRLISSRLVCVLIGRTEDPEASFIHRVPKATRAGAPRVRGHPLWDSCVL